MHFPMHHLVHFFMHLLVHFPIHHLVNLPLHLPWQVLEGAGADLWVPNCRGDLPLHEAIQCGNRFIFLLQSTQYPDLLNLCS